MMRPINMSAFKSLVFVSAIIAGSHAFAVNPGSDQVTAPLSQRFAPSENASEVPDFQKHISPLLGRLGCNGRACHGSFQGRGGFQLSLFGYDFQADHKALMEADTARVDVDDVSESLILAKPTDEDMHEGGKRFDAEEWQYQVLSKWVSAGAKFDDKQIHQLDRLDIQPAELIFTKQDEATQLRAIAYWEDGSSEDVTEICRFRSNDSAIASIDETGNVISKGVGDTHVVISYDNAVVPIPVLRPVSAYAGSKYPATKDQTEIDRLITQKLRKLGIIASEICTDEEFLRRVHLDVAGTLPTAVEVEKFLDDTNPNKRQNKVAELLDSPGYAAWWTTKFCDWTGNSDTQLNNVSPVTRAVPEHWYEWVHKRLDENMPYDKIVEGIVVAKSREEGESYLDYCKAMGDACQKGSYDKFADRSGMPYFWERRNFKSTEDRAIGFAYTFLGIRIQCAQCHKHPFDRWSKQDFDEFKNLFQTAVLSQKPRPGDGLTEYNAMIKEFDPKGELKGNQLRRMLAEKLSDGEVIPFPELVERPVRAPKKTVRKKGKKPVQVKVVPKAKLLGGDYVELDSNARTKLMDWLRGPENPYFAKAIVNRVWHNYFGVGIVDPVDDLNLANPPSNAALFDYLTEGFVDHGYDLKWLHREITASDAYQRSWVTNETNVLDKKNFSHILPRRLPAEVLYDAVLIATASDAKSAELCSSREDRAVAIASASTRQSRGGPGYALQVFGRSIRESNCDCDRSEEPNLLQTVYMQNDQDIAARLYDRNSWLAQQMKELGQPMPTNTAAESLKNKRLVDSVKRQKKSLEAQKKSLTLRFEKLKKDNASEKQMEGRQRAYQKQMAAINNRLKALKLNEAKATPRKVTQDQLEHLVKEAYLRTLSRRPQNDEVENSLAFIDQSETVSEGVGGLIWALINTKEFILNH